jgi:ribosomal protein S27AE
MPLEEPTKDEEKVYCLNCSAQLPKSLRFCPVCGARNPLYIEHKDRVTAGLLAVMLGIFGGHKFYLKEYTQGVIYLFFFWTLIPAVLGIVEGINFLTMSEAQFQVMY